MSICVSEPVADRSYKVFFQSKRTRAEFLIIHETCQISQGTYALTFSQGIAHMLSHKLTERELKGPFVELLTQVINMNSSC